MTVYDDTNISELLRRLRRDAVSISKLTPSDQELADTVGLTREIEVRLADTRHRWEQLTAEMEPVYEPDTSRRVNEAERAGPPVAVGKRYELVPQYKTVRTYNTPAILVAIAEATGMGPIDALQDALGADAVRLSWRWTQLKRYLRDRHVTIRIGHDAVSDHDGTDQPMVGEVRVQSGVKRVPLRDET